MEIERSEEAPRPPDQGKKSREREREERGEGREGKVTSH